jgi:glycosyltransferase involved in cell wall biosynthesis
MGFMALPVALDLARRSGGVTVYDARDLYADARSLARFPRPARGLMRARERTWARGADRVLTVNDGLADILADRFAVPRPVVVMNCPPRWTPPDPPERRFHAALGLPAGTRVVLYHGGLVPERGIEQLMAAAPALPADAAVVLLGYGPLRDALADAARAAGPAGRVHVLDAVPPAELLGWVAAADVVVAAIQPTTLNHRLSTPNKLFEALAAGVPVVASDFPAMHAIVLDDPDGPLGAVCDPTDPAAIAAAVRGILELDPVATADLRARCLGAAHARYSWERQLEVLVAMYADLSGSPW